MEHKKGQTVHSEARNLVRRVIRKCDEEARKHEMLYPLKQATNRAAEYVGLSRRTISRIRKEDAMYDENKRLPSPGRKRPRKEEKKFHCSAEDKMVVRNIIHNFYAEQKVKPTGPKLLIAIQEKIFFPWSLKTLYKLLKSMGFKYKRSNTNKKILVEKFDIVACRTKYLKMIDCYRKQSKNIIYIGETYIDNTLYFQQNYWQNEEILNIRKPSHPTQRLIILHAGGKDGFVDGAGLMFKSSSTTGNYQSEISVENFEIWINENLLPNIPANSVIVMNNDPYCSVQLNKPPAGNAKKEFLIKWLIENKIPYNQNMRKSELYDLIKKHKSSDKIYKVDEYLKSKGHNTLRLPPHMPELNPMQLAWSQVKRKLAEEDTSALPENEFQKYIIDAIDEVKPNIWLNFFTYIENLETEYWKKDEVIEEILDAFEIQSDDSETETDESTCSEDEEK